MNASKLDALLGRLLRSAGYAIDCTRIDGKSLTMDDRKRVRAILAAYGVDVAAQARKVVPIGNATKQADSNNRQEK